MQVEGWGDTTEDFDVFSSPPNSWNNPQLAQGSVTLQTILLPLSLNSNHRVALYSEAD